MSNPACACCGGAEPEVELTRLWDDRWYCRDCVDQAASGLFDYAREHSVLEEVIDTETLRTLRTPRSWLIRWLLRPAIVLAVSLWTLYEFGGWEGWLLFALAIVSTGLRAGFLWKARSLFWLDTSLPMRVAAADGAISVRRGELATVKSPLEAWTWWIASDWRKASARNPPIQRAITLTARDAPRDMYFCGTTAESRDRWHGFLKLADVRRGGSAIPSRRFR